MEPLRILALDRKYVFRKAFVPFIIGKASGSVITDAYGKRYIDLMGGLYGAISVGWQRPEVITAMKRQMDKCNFAPEKAPSEQCSMLAESLVRLTHNKLRKCLRATSGTEAVELAVKAASKAGIISLTQFFAKAYSRSMVINSVSPGLTNTDVLKLYKKKEIQRHIDETPLHRIMQPEEVAEAVAFLATHGAVNGHNLIVDGGRLRR